MKGFFTKPQKPSEVVRKLKLTELVSTSGKTEEEISNEVTLLEIDGKIPRRVYSTFSEKTSSDSTLPYAFFEDISNFCWEIFEEIHYKFYNAKKSF
jgi:hypothetical protein